jgi:hypothetical protein
MGGEAFAEVALEPASAPDAIHVNGLEDDGLGKVHGRNNFSHEAGRTTEKIGKSSTDPALPQVRQDYVTVSRQPVRLCPV